MSIHFLPRLRRSALTLALLMALPAPLPAQSQTARPDTWDATFVAGPVPMKPGTRVRVLVSDDSVILSSGHGPGISISIPTIVDVISHSRVRYPAWDAQMKAWRVWAAATGGYGLVFFPFGLPFMIGSTAAKSHEYMFSIVWRKGELEENVVFAVREKDYTPVLDEINRVSGKNWKNAQTEWQKVEQALKQQPENTFFVEIDRPIEIGGAAVKRGKYTVVFLPRADNLGELYFFQGHGVDTAKLALASPAMMVALMGPDDPGSPAHQDVRISTPAKVEPAPPGTETMRTEVIYKSANGASTIAEIRTPKKTLRLP